MWIGGWVPYIQYCCFIFNTEPVYLQTCHFKSNTIKDFPFPFLRNLCRISTSALTKLQTVGLTYFKHTACHLLLISVPVVSSTSPQSHFLEEAEARGRQRRRHWDSKMNHEVSCLSVGFCHTATLHIFLLFLRCGFKFLHLQSVHRVSSTLLDEFSMLHCYKVPAAMI